MLFMYNVSSREVPRLRDPRRQRAPPDDAQHEAARRRHAEQPPGRSCSDRFGAECSYGLPAKFVRRMFACSIWCFPRDCHFSPMDLHWICPMDFLRRGSCRRSYAQDRGRLNHASRSARVVLAHGAARILSLYSTVLQCRLGGPFLS